jgi:hypothetical protein
MVFLAALVAVLSRAFDWQETVIDAVDDYHREFSFSVNPNNVFGATHGSLAVCTTQPAYLAVGPYRIIS